MKDGVVLVEPFLAGNAVAFVSGGKVQDFFIDFERSNWSLVGATFVGEVDRLSKNSNSCFVRLPKNQVGFLRRARGLKSGDKLLLQSRLFSPEDKAVLVSTNLSFKGRYVIITPRKKMLTFSRSISGKGIRQGLRTLGNKYQEIQNRKCGIIFRTLCKFASEKKIKEDLEIQLERCRRVTATKLNDIGLIEPPPNALQRAKQDWHSLESQEVIKEHQCFDKFGIWEQILLLRESSIKLPSGGNIRIEPTQALVAIDVNTGSDSSPAASLRANIQAITEIPRQLRLRGLGGKIVVEMGPLSRSHREKIESNLQKTIAPVPDKIRIAGWTALGNLELEKSRDRIPLGEIQFNQIEKSMGV